MNIMTSEELQKVYGGAILRGIVTAPHYAINFVCEIIRSIFKR